MHHTLITPARPAGPESGTSGGTTCTVERCVCRTRRNPAALPAAAHRPTGTPGDRAYRKALGVFGSLPASIGTVAHGGTASARRSAARNSHRRSTAPRSY